MSQTPTTGRIGEPFIILPSVESTNNYAMGEAHAGMASHGMAVLALEQLEGKGQRNNKWLAAPGENITISFIITPSPLLLKQQFLLSAVSGLACYDLFKNYTDVSCQLKWPNDLYWNDRKAGGILIENIVRGNEWKYTIIGIGLNINQTSFPDSIRNPVSLKQITGKHWNIVDLGKELSNCLDKQYKRILKKQYEEILIDYNDVLYKKDLPVKLKKDGIIIDIIIKGVSIEGKLLTGGDADREFNFGEMEWVTEFEV